jgi:hypothetical protein
LYSRRRAVVNPFTSLHINLHTALDQSGISFAVGGFDISLNEHQTGAFASHWKPHAWVIVGETDYIFGKQRFIAHFPRAQDTVPRPVLTRAWDGNLRAIAYALKGKFHRRITLVPEITTEGQKKRRNVRYRDLRVGQKVELLIELDRIGLRRRLFLKGVEVIEQEEDVKLRKLSES